MTEQVDRWWTLPEQTRTHVLSLLAALIARGVLIETTTDAATSNELLESEVSEDE